jgi:hydroxypyruvate isomerase
MSTVPSFPADLSRRSLIGATLGGAALVAAGCTGDTARAPAKPTTTDNDDPTWRITKGRIKQSVVGWCFNPMETPVLAKAAAELGFKSVELVDPKHWPMLKELGLTCAIVGSHGFVKGFNKVENHAMCVQKISERIEQAAAFGCPNVITFSGMREGISDEEGIKNCVAGIKQVIGLAEQKKITLCMEVLNSRVNENMKGHPDYQADRLEFAREVCKQVGSPRMKILFDLYHTQIMQGDLITRIKEFHEYVGHYHTAGVPGRGELDENQEINYPAVMRAIVATGYTGFVGQEFIPTWTDKIKALRHAAQVCDV